MPRIPLSNGPDRLGHVSDSARMSGGPSLSGQHIEVQADEARALRGFGEAISLAGGAISDSLLQYAKTSIEVDNRLAAAEAQNLYRSIQDELQTRMKENPNQFDQFEGWAKDADKRYTEEVKSITDRMTPGYRQLFDEEMRGRRIESVGQQMRIGIQAKTAAQKEKYMYLYKDACSRMDPIQARQLTATAKETGLISEEEAELREREIGRFVDLEEVKLLCESNPEKCLMRLQGYTAEGYAFFPNITQEDRDKWIRFSEAKAGRFRQEQDYKFLASIVDGNQLYTRDEIKQMRDAEQITNEQYVRWNKWLDADKKKKGEEEYYSVIARFASGDFIDIKKGKLEQLHKEGKLTDEEYVRFKNVENSLNKQQETSKKTRAKYEFLYDIETSETLYAHPNLNKQWVSARIQKAERLFGDDPETLLEVRSAIMRKAKDVSAGTDLFSNPENKRVLNFIKAKRALSQKDVLTDVQLNPFADAHSDVYYDAIDAARVLLKSGKTPDDVIKIIADRIAEYNKEESRAVFKTILRNRQKGQRNGK